MEPMSLKLVFGCTKAGDVKSMLMLCQMCLTEVLYDGFIFEGMGANCLNCHHHCHLLSTTVSTCILGYLHICKETVSCHLRRVLCQKRSTHVRVHFAQAASHDCVAVCCVIYCIIKIHLLNVLGQCKFLLHFFLYSVTLKARISPHMV